MNTAAAIHDIKAGKPVMCLFQSFMCFNVIFWSVNLIWKHQSRSLTKLVISSTIFCSHAIRGVGEVAWGSSGAESSISHPR
jgi:hypothetical protein